MRNIFPLSAMFFILLLSVITLPSAAQEKVIFNETVTWAWPLPQSYGGNSFYWWHRTVDGYSIYNLGDMPSDDWKSPADYENGAMYLRIQVISQPTSSPFTIQLGIWQDVGKSGGHSECISGNLYVSGGAGSSAESSIGKPNDWWEIRTDAPVDWTRPEDFHRMGLILWKGYTDCIPMAQGWSNSQACSDASTQQANFFPMTVRITLVACAQGTSFSGWANYPGDGGGGTRPPTPTYGIDYTNERTSTVVASTDEYSYNQSTWTSGSGNYLSLTPGQNVYFRVKAEGENLPSYTQTLSVPSRPAAPTFTYDAVNQRTMQAVSSEYEYSENSNMSSAVSGSGTYVSFPTGSTRYFRKKATGSAFRSNIQTLVGTASGPSSNIGPEFVILNEIIEYPNSTDNNGFYFFYYNTSMPTNWLSSYDYYNGQVYTRYEILSQASSEPVGLQFGIWQVLPPGTGTLYENMEPVRTLNGPGSVVTNNSSPNTWWKYNGGADFTQMDKVWHFGINPYKVDPTQEQIRSENADVWAERFTYWFPMVVKVTVVAVASGHTFSGWDNYIQPETAPEYEIDYVQERTASTVSSTHEYSYNQSTWTSGNDGYLSLTPGQDVYFRKKLTPTLVQHLTVPARPAAPSFTINYAQEKTAETIPATVQYANNSGFSGAQDGSGAQVNVTPGGTLYFRYKATASAFTSSALTLTAPARPTVTSSVTSPTNQSPFTVNIAFPYAVTGFESNDLLVTNGSVSSLSGTYTASITPAATGQVGISVKANAVNENNFASTVFVMEYDGPSGLEDLNGGQFRLYPTLADAYIILESKDIPEGNYQIFDAAGSRVGQGSILNTRQEISTETLAPGIYQLVVLFKDKKETFRFVRLKR